MQEEDEVPDDETVNQMIARSEEEFDQFMVSVCVLKICYSSYKSSPTALTPPKSSRYVFVALPFFFSSPSLSVWTWTGVARRPVTRGENLV